MVDKPGGNGFGKFTAVNIVKLNITDTPEGWTVTADLQIEPDDRDGPRK